MSDVTVVLLVFAEVLGALTSINALMTTRTSQGAIAWIVSLNSMPWLAVPAYWIFGRDRFRGYVLHRRRLAQTHSEAVAALRARAERYRALSSPLGIAERLVGLPFLSGNRVTLLENGEETFRSIFEGIDEATNFLFVQFYIVRDDGLGKRLQEKLMQKARAGVRVYFLYDEIGSAGLPNRYVEALREAGVAVSPFHSTRGRGNRFQLNFRNHRKIVVVDGRVGWVGGHNVGDEYLGLDPNVGAWRDTHLRLDGPSVLGLLVAFAEDWRWATGETLSPDLWEPPLDPEGPARVAIVPTGPADRLESASLMFQAAIHSARARVWIASPYFVPDQAVTHALHLAALRGVDVRILIPERPDNRLVYFSAYAFVGALLESGVRIYRYLPGFLHEKVFLVDDRVAGVGTANFDNRSFRLNFEVTALVQDGAFVEKVEQMFERDFAASREMTAAEVEGMPFWFRLAARASYLTAPIQ